MIRRLFSLMDVDKNNRLTRQEFQFLAVPALSPFVRTQAAESFLTAADGDGDGKFSPEEFLNGEEWGGRG